MRNETYHGGPGLTVLVPLETTVQTPMEAPLAGITHHDDLGLAFRHAGWHRERALVDAALAAIGAPDNRLAAFRGCGRDAWVLRSEQHPDQYRIRADYCHSRWCIPCAVHRSTITAARIRDWLGDLPARFITLTIASDHEPLAPRLDRLYTAFRRLRRTEWWRGRVQGGVACVEVKWSVKSAHWHPHLHILCHSAYLDKKDLSREWHIATGDSYIVDISLVESAALAASYVAKYAAKPAPAATYRDADRLQEMMLAMHGRRLFLTFGDCKLPDKPAEENPDTWVRVQSLDEILWKVRRGVPVAPEILALLRMENPCTITKTNPRCLGPPPPPPCRSQNWPTHGGP